MGSLRLLIALTRAHASETISYGIENIKKKNKQKKQNKNKEI